MWIRTTKYLLGLIVVAGLFYLVWLNFLTPSSINDSALTYTVHKRTVVDTVVERGTLESQNTVSGKCELPGWQNKIIFILPEGSKVTKGQVVVRFDSTEIDNQIRAKKAELITAKGEVEQAEEDIKVQKNTNASLIAAAELKWTLAKLDLKKYVKSDFLATRDDLKRSIAEAEAELKKSENELENSIALVKKGFLPPEALREIRLRKNSATFRLDRDRSKLKGLIEFEKPRKVAELEFNSKEAQRTFDRAKKTADAQIRKKNSIVQQKKNALALHENQLKRMEKEKTKCEITSPVDGTLAYANKPWFDPSERIKNGSTIRREQDVFYLPDMKKMQVNVEIHESLINKVEKGQTVAISVDAYPELKLEGTVQKVSQLANSSWRTNVNNYQATVQINDFPDEVKLKPGMTAEVEIQVGVYPDVIAIPINGSTEFKQENFAFLKNGNQYERKKIELGRFTNHFLEVKSGLKDGDVIALDAFKRGQAEFSSLESENKEKEGMKGIPVAGK